MLDGLTVIKIFLSIGLGFFLGYLSVYLFNKMPIKWLSDETEIKRINSYPWKPTIAVFLMFSILRMLIFSIPYGIAGSVTLFALLGIVMSDIRYMTIPDIYLVILAISAFGYINFYGSMHSNILGALVGFVIMFLINIVGKLLHREEVLGFGDVKLCGILGFIVGLNGIILIIFIFSICSGIFGVFSLVRGRLNRKSVFPLAPFISLAAWLYIVIIYTLPFREEFSLIVL